MPGAQNLSSNRTNCSCSSFLLLMYLHGYISSRKIDTYKNSPVNWPFNQVDLVCCNERQQHLSGMQRLTNKYNTEQHVNNCNYIHYSQCKEHICACAHHKNNFKIGEVLTLQSSHLQMKEPFYLAEIMFIVHTYIHVSGAVPGSLCIGTLTAQPSRTMPLGNAWPQTVEALKAFLHTCLKQF